MKSNTVAHDKEKREKYSETSLNVNIYANINIIVWTLNNETTAYFKKRVSAEKEPSKVIRGRLCVCTNSRYRRRLWKLVQLLSRIERAASQQFAFNSSNIC